MQHTALALNINQANIKSTNVFKVMKHLDDLTKFQPVKDKMNSLVLAITGSIIG